MSGGAIVVTGVPASGKSSLARRIASEIGFPLLDKDDFLEALYETNAVPDIEARRALSRESDALFIAAARQAPSAVLVSHWRNAVSGPASGTPTDWLGDTYDRAIEVFCRCDVEEAARRFRERRRHPGHRDADRNPGTLAPWFADYASALPLGLGPLVEVDTSGDIDLPAVLAATRDLLRY